MNLRGRNKVSSEFSMSSMTDIVFLLLVFFMLTTPAVTPEALDLILPKAKGKSTNQQNISVSVTKEGDYYVNGDPVSDDRLESAIQSNLQGVDDPTIILNAANQAVVQNAVDVMSIANKYKYKIILAVKPR
jgi:biopolymer transport protein ExbD